MHVSENNASASREVDLDTFILRGHNVSTSNRQGRLHERYILCA